MRVVCHRAGRASAWRISRGRVGATYDLRCYSARHSARDALEEIAFGYFEQDDQKQECAQPRGDDHDEFVVEHLWKYTTIC